MNASKLILLLACASLVFANGKSNQQQQQQQDFCKLTYKCSLSLLFAHDSDGVIELILECKNAEVKRLSLPKSSVKSCPASLLVKYLALILGGTSINTHNIFVNLNEAIYLDVTMGNFDTESTTWDSATSTGVEILYSAARSEEGILAEAKSKI